MCDIQGLTHSTVPDHREECLLQQVECEYKCFGCAVVLPRKDLVEHLKESVELHLQLTRKELEEMEVKADRKRMSGDEGGNGKEEVRLWEQYMRLRELQAIYLGPFDNRI